eukprot:696184-Amorphochlora_amoeboformis.AAC.1
MEYAHGSKLWRIAMIDDLSRIIARLDKANDSRNTTVVLCLGERQISRFAQGLERGHNRECSCC